MAIALEEVKRLIEDALPGATAEVEDPMNDGNHLSATVRAPQFEGLSRVAQHRLVLKAVRERMDDGSLHALTVKTIPATEEVEA